MMEQKEIDDKENQGKQLRFKLSEEDENPLENYKMRAIGKQKTGDVSPRKLNMNSARTRNGQSPEGMKKLRTQVA